MIQVRPVYVICMREFIKFFREKSRLLGTLARPVLWLFVVGNGMSALIRPQTGFSYLQFIFPGMIGMTILFSSIFSSISIVWDREFGFMKEMLVAPISRLSIVVGKAVSGTFISVAQAVIILVLVPFLGIRLSAAQFFEVVAVAVLVSFCITSLGILIAARLTSFDGFNIIMNFLVMPMLFLSGAMYPVTSMPAALRHLDPHRAEMLSVVVGDVQFRPVVPSQNPRTTVGKVLHRNGISRFRVVQVDPPAHISSGEGKSFGSMISSMTASSR